MSIDSSDPSPLPLPRFEGKVSLKTYEGYQSPYRGADPGMELLEDFSFIDKRSVKWTAHRLDIVDGASIPWFMQWIGTPYNRTYLGPAVLHDVYCRDKQRGWWDTHRMFYEAMLLNQVPKWKAYTMWTAVLTFGPKWKYTRKDAQFVEVQKEASFPDKMRSPDE